MLKMKRLVLVLVAVMLFGLVFGNTNSYATSGIRSISANTSNTNTNENTENTNTNSNTNENTNTNSNTNSNVNTNSNSINSISNNSSNYSNSNTNTSKSSSLPYTGLKSTVVFVAIAFVASSIYAYRKVSEYKNI